jgi:hypothetical protein
MATDVEALQREAAGPAVQRRNGCRGRHAGEHVVAAARVMFTWAIADGLICAGASPAQQIGKPRRLPSPAPSADPERAGRDQRGGPDQRQ